MSGTFDERRNCQGSLLKRNKNLLKLEPACRQRLRRGPMHLIMHFVGTESESMQKIQLETCATEFSSYVLRKFDKDENSTAISGSIFAKNKKAI